MTTELIVKVKGHRAPVCCLASVDSTDTVVSGGEDGAICSFDARAGKLTSRIKVAQGDEAVPSLALHPHDSNRLYCCTGSDILCLDRRQEGQAGRLWSQGFNTEEVNSIDISPCGRLLVSADDAGQVAVINLEEGTLVQRLIKGHTNIASSAVFQGQNSWQVVSGGLDCQILCWDFSGDTVLQRWDLDPYLQLVKADRYCLEEMMARLGYRHGMMNVNRVIIPQS